MRNFFLTLIAFLFFSFAGNAQKFNLKQNEEPFHKGGMADYKEKIYSLGFFDGKFYYYKNYPLSKKKPDEIIAVDDKANFSVVNTVNIENKLKNGVAGITGRRFSNETEFGFFDINRDANVIKFSKYVFSSGKSKAKVKEVTSITLQKDEHHKIYSSISPDKSKIAYLVNALTLKKGDLFYDRSYLLMFDNNGNLLWQTNFKLNFANSSFRIEGIAVNNDAEAYIVSLSYENKKNRQENQVIETFLANENGIESRRKSDKKGVNVTDMSFITLNNGNLFIGGYYSHKSVNTNRETGYFGHDKGDFESYGKFGLLLNKDDLSEIAFNVIDFKNSIPKGATYDESYSHYYYTLVNTIIETADGNITLFGEEYRQEPGNNYVPPMAKTRNLIIDAFNQSGELVNSSILFKKQERYSSLLAVFSDVIKVGDKIFAIYNESNTHSLKVNKPIDDEYEMKKYKKEGIVVLCEIKNGLPQEKQQIMDCAVSQKLFVSGVVLTDNSLLVRTMQDTKSFLNVLSW